jgi:uncharacterized integral membrane protein
MVMHDPDVICPPPFLRPRCCSAFALGPSVTCSWWTRRAAAASSRPSLSGSPTSSATCPGAWVVGLLLLLLLLLLLVLTVMTVEYAIVEAIRRSCTSLGILLGMLIPLTS